LSQLQQEQDLTVLEPSISSQKKRILVVDDEVDITTIFKLALEKVNLHVEVYNDPLLALSDYKAGMHIYCYLISGCQG
jgi:DNA-binding NtrC family response regulator